MLWRDWVAKRELLKPGENASHRGKAFTTQNVTQVVDQQLIDTLMKYMKSPDGLKYGLGGAVAAGVISQEVADELRAAESGQATPQT
jgi:hypothetical protein